VLRRAGLDPAALPPGGFPTLSNPFDGDADPISRFVVGLLVSAPPDCALLASSEAIVDCLLARVTAVLDGLPSGAAPTKLRRQLGRRLGAVRAKVEAAKRATAGSRRRTRALAKADRRADALVALLARAIARNTLVLPAGASLVVAATELADALGQ
jgi:hypothetical protein